MTTEKVLDVLEADEKSEAQNDDPFTFTTHTGIKFNLKPVPPLLLSDAQKRIEEPKPPKVLIADKDSYEENPDDPDYRRALRAYQEALGETTNAIMLTRGTSILHVPSGVDHLDSEDWVEDVKDLTQIEVPPSGRRRYYCWLKYVALSSMDDFTRLIRKISSLGGITMEEDVAQAANDFRSSPEGDSAAGVPATEEDGRGADDSSTTTGSRT